MIEYILIAIFLGLVAGTLTGLIPGIHINLLALLLFSSSAFFLQFTDPSILVVFIISMAVTHTFLDFLPSIFLGAPDEDTALSVLPGHRLLLKGKGYGAVKLTVVGSFFGLLIALALAPFFIVTLPYFYPFLIKIIVFLLIAIVIFLIFKEEKSKRIPALFLFLLAGILGYATLNFPLIKQPLFPLFTGLFGASLLAISIVKNVKLPEQKIKPIKIKRKNILQALGLGIFSSSLVSFLPGVGSSQAAVISSGLKKIDEKTFLILLGAINTIVMILSFIVLYSVSRPRTGIAVFIGRFLGIFSEQQLWLFLAVALLAGSLAVFITFIFARIFSKNIAKIDYKKLCLAILVFLTILVPILSGWLALLVFITATALGISTSMLGIRKMYLMGCLILPVIIWYLI
ncbi:MAG: tripartite tricarboxylate transporter permease [Candidatus Pacearchaeota archaeon]|nr:MAG: tripartite tricarboxylate transporter permease [Candidatus Pacearchaeota archaeon]